MDQRYRGCLLGLALGDALGRPTEFLSTAEVRGRYGPAGLTDLVGDGRHRAGTFTDDTQMTIALAEGLLEVADDDLEARMAAVARRFAAWSASPENNRAPGNTCMKACARLRQGVPWRESGVPGSKGCGTAMRAAPVGLVYHHGRDRLVEVACASSLITHDHPCAHAGAVANALAVSLALDNQEPAKILDEVLRATRPISEEFVRRVERVPEVLAEPPEAAFAVLGDAWVAEEAVACALYCFLRSPDDYRATVLCGANAPGDSDSVACIAGGISGAYLGLEAIPERWLEQLERREELVELADRLREASG